MSQYDYEDLIDRLINKELRFEALAAHEQYEFLEEARGRCFQEDYESLINNLKDVKGELVGKNREIQRLKDEIYKLGQKNNRLKNYAGMRQNPNSHKKAELITKLETVYSLLQRTE